MFFFKYLAVSKSGNLVIFVIFSCSDGISEMSLASHTKSWKSENVREGAAFARKEDALRMARVQM